MIPCFFMKNGTRSKLDLVPLYKIFKSCRHMVDSVHSSLILLAFRGEIKSDSRQQLFYYEFRNIWPFGAWF